MEIPEPLDGKMAARFWLEGDIFVLVLALIIGSDGILE